MVGARGAQFRTSSCYRWCIIEASDSTPWSEHSPSPLYQTDGAELLFFPGAMKYEFHYFPTLQVTRGCQVLLQVEVEVNRVPFESSNQIVPGGLESSVPNNWPTCAGTQSCESESRWTWNENPWYFGFGFSRLWGLDHANYVNPDFFNTVAWVLVQSSLGMYI